MHPNVPIVEDFFFAKRNATSACAIFYNRNIRLFIFIEINVSEAPACIVYRVRATP